MRRDLEVLFGKFIRIPAINIEPVTLNTALADLLDSVNGPFAAGGRFFVATVNPDGRIQLPRLGGIYVLGMSLEEIRREVNLRYEERVVGIEVEPRLTRQAQHFIFVFGKVAQQGRFELLGPTTALAGWRSQEVLCWGKYQTSRNHATRPRIGDWWQPCWTCVEHS